MNTPTIISTTTFKTETGEYNLMCSFYIINPENKLNILNLIDSIKNNVSEKDMVGYIDIKDILEISITNSINNLCPKGYIIIRDTKCLLTNLIGKSNIICIIKIDKLTIDSATGATNVIEFDRAHNFEHVFLANFEIINKLQENSVTLIRANLYSILELLLNRKIIYSNHNKNNKKIVDIFKDIKGFITIPDLINVDISLLEAINNDNNELSVITSNNTSILDLLKYISERTFNIENLGLYYIYNTRTKTFIPFYLKPYIQKKLNEVINNSKGNNIIDNNKSASNYVGFLVSQGNSTGIVNINQNVIKSLYTANVNNPVKNIIDLADYVYNKFDYLSESDNFKSIKIKSKNIITNLNFYGNNASLEQLPVLNTEYTYKALLPENIIGNMDANNTLNFANVKSESLAMESFIYQKINDYLIDNSCNILLSGSLVRNPGDLFYIMAFKTAAEQMHPADFAYSEIWLIIKRDMLFKENNFFDSLYLSRFMSLKNPIEAYDI